MLGNIGVAGAALAAMWRVYWRAVAMSPTNFGGGAALPQTPTVVLVVVEYPIVAFLVLGLIGFFAGGLGYIVAMRSKR